jgi:hypothetical protein
MGKQPSGTLPKLLLKPANLADLIEDLPDVVSTSKGQKRDATEASGVECG